MRTRGRQECHRAVGAKDQDKQWRDTSKGRAGPLYPGTTETAISKTLLICRGAHSRAYRHCCDFHRF